MKAINQFLKSGAVLLAPTENLKAYCYSNMFFNCTNLNEAWVKANYTNANYECSNMFIGCKSGGEMHTGGTGWAVGTSLPTGWTTSSYE